MSYRVEKHKPHKPNRTAQKTSTPSRYFVENGTTFDLAIPCWYYEINPPIRARHHCKPWHDHVGHPSPSRPDRSCQPHDFASECHHHGHGGHHERHHGHHGHHHHCHHTYIDMAKLIPIHLTEEGYDKVEVIFDQKVDGLKAKGYIDDRDDWVVRVHFDVAVGKAVDEPMDIRFIIKAICTEDNMIDVVSRGMLRIEPAPLGE